MKKIVATSLFLFFLACTPPNRHIEVSKAGLALTVKEKVTEEGVEGGKGKEKTVETKYLFENRDAYTIVYHAVAILKKSVKSTVNEENEEELRFLPRNQVDSLKMAEVVKEADTNGDTLITTDEAKEVLEKAKKVAEKAEEDEKTKTEKPEGG